MRKNIFLLLLIVTSVSTYSQNTLEKFVNCDILKNANISLAVKDLTSGKILYNYRSGNASIPASTMKVVTTSTAVELLGANHQIKTSLEYDGNIDAEGILHGNLYIKGNGDPTLGSRILGDTLFLHRWVQEVKRIGIKKVTGSIIADNSCFDDEGVNPHWTWQDIGNYYAAGAYGIAYKDNTYTIQFNSKAVGTTPEIVKITPRISELKFINHLKSTSIKSDSAYIYGAPRSFERSIYGEIPANRANFSIKGDIPRPGLLLAQDFKKELAKSKIEVVGSAKDIFGKTNTGRKNIYNHLSPPLKDIVKEINVNSNNHYAEHIFRYLSLQNQTQATSTHSISIIKNFWKSKSLSPEQLFMYDGCGLSPENAVSAQFFIDLLTYMNSSMNNFDFRNSLPIAGISGTVKTFLDKTVLEGKVQAKSGTINRVRCFVGYIDTTDKKWTFAILVNNANGTAKAVTDKMEEFLIEITQ